MAAPRKSVSQVDARRRARERAAQFRERENTLEQLAAEYIVNADRVEQIEEKLAEEIAALQARADRETAQARDESAQIIRRMSELGVAKTEISARLDVPSRTVRSALASSSDADVSDGSTAVSRADGHTSL